MSHLLDVNVLVACAWQSHADHRRANRWLERTRSFATTAVTEMGFLRVSMSPAFGAAFADAAEALQAIVGMRGHRFLRDGTRGRSLPAITSGRDVTDAHLVRLAARYKLKLATLDAALCTRPWAYGVAEHLA
jgi:toxin-antitoxin system PIN domain toxin